MIIIKLNWNKNYTTIAVYSLLVIVASILFVVFIFKFDTFASGFSWVGEITAPIIIGIAIAYIINPLVTLFEDKVFVGLREGGSYKIDPADPKSAKKIEKKRSLRTKAAKVFSVIISFLIVIAAVVGICIAVVPSVAQSVVDLADQMPQYIANAEQLIDDTFANNPQLGDYISEEFMQLSSILQKFSEMMEPVAGDILGTVSVGLIELVSGILAVLKNGLIGLVIAIYLIFSKDRLLAQVKKIMFALFKNDKCQSFLHVCTRSNSIFKKFIVSNLLDAVIIFIAMLIGMWLMDMPYAMLISVVCGVTNLIPFFGPFIGAIPCALLILIADDPIKVLWFCLFVLVLQQLDGNVIKPLLFGETVGLPAIWVLVSIIVTGGFFGIPGMLLGVPVFAVIYMLVADFVAERLKKKNMPTETDSYIETAEYNGNYSAAEKKE